jgi:mannose-1-phosphate guanylyltransferase
MPTFESCRGSVYGFIMAGGVGTRLWPRSREASPKQFLDLIGPHTMLQQAYHRLLPLIPAERILVSTGKEHVPLVRDQLPDAAAENIIAEPDARGTAPAIGLGALQIRARDSDGIMVVVTADHHIADVAAFQRAVRAAVEVAASGRLVTLGIEPSFPSTGYGYIHRGERLDSRDGLAVYRVERFTEKPDSGAAQAFLDSGAYSWNSGMFVWKASAILGEFERQMPELYAQLGEIEAALGTEDEGTVLERVWAAVARETIDYGIMEHAADVGGDRGGIVWNNIGSWQTLMGLLDANEEGNVVTGEAVTLDRHDTLVYSPNRLVAAIGLEGLIVVDTGDALLICRKEASQRVREVVEVLRARVHRRLAGGGLWAVRGRDSGGFLRRSSG